MAHELKPLIEKLIARTDLTREEAESGVRAVIAGCDQCQTAAFLVLLRAKGETPAEVAGMVTAMRDHMVPVNPGGTVVDIVGTGGDGHHTVNFSTAASFVAASCGAKVAKHGNRSAAAVAQRWAWQNGVPFITATTSSAHLEGTLGIFRFELTEEEMAELDAKAPSEAATYSLTCSK